MSKTNESDADQAWIIGGRPGGYTQSFESRVHGAHRGDDAPSEIVEVSRGRHAESARRSGDDADAHAEIVHPQVHLKSSGGKGQS